MNDDAIQFAENVRVESVTLFASRTARVELVTSGTDSRKMSVTLVNPRPIDTCATLVSSGLDAIRILDQNVMDGGWREFGRFRVELWDEDGEFAAFEADSFVTKTDQE